MNKFYVYIIKSSEGYTYMGLTEDLDKRLFEHNSKSLSFWTKRGSNWNLIHSEEFSNKTEALNRERWFKTGVGRDFIKSLLTH